MPLTKRLFFLLLAAGQAAYALDIAGVALGSNMQDTRVAVAKANPKLRFTEIELDEGKGIGLLAKESGHPAIDGPNAGLYDEFVVLLNEAGKVWYAVRNVNTSSENRIVHRGLVLELMRKYGGPASQSWVAPHVMAITWTTYRSGKMYVGAADKGPCGLLSAGGLIPGTTVRMPHPLKPECGSLVVASLPRVSLDGKIASYSISVAGAQPMQIEDSKPTSSVR